MDNFKMSEAFYCIHLYFLEMSGKVVADAEPDDAPDKAGKDY